MALDWVQANIFKFGGNKDKITLGGHMAGACCVQAMAEEMKNSKTAKRWFHFLLFLF